MGGCPCGGCIRGVRDPDRAEEETESRMDDRAQRFERTCAKDRETVMQGKIVDAVKVVHLRRRAVKLSLQNVDTTRAEGQGIEYALKYLGLWEEGRNNDEGESGATPAAD